MLNKIHILGATLVAVLALGALAAGSASAAQWLLNGKAMTESKHAVTEGTWLLLGLAFGGFIKTHVECNGVLLGTVGPNKEDSVSKVYGLNGETETTLSCTVLLTKEGACEGSDTALVKAEHLPWKTELLEPKRGEFIDDFKSSGSGLPAFDVECTLSNGSKFLELCEGETKTDALSNVTGGVSGELLNQESSKCNTAGNVSHVYGKGVVKTLEGTLTVSK